MSMNIFCEDKNIQAGMDNIQVQQSYICLQTLTKESKL